MKKSLILIPVLVFCGIVAMGQGVITRPTTPKKTEQKQTTKKSQGQQSLTVAQMVEKGDDAFNNRKDKEAFGWYSKAAEKGDAYSQLMLGIMYEEGLGVRKDLKKAAKWFLKAAEQGDTYAQSRYDDIMKR